MQSSSASAGPPDARSRGGRKANSDRSMPPGMSTAAAETPRQLIREAHPGDLHAARDLAYNNSGSPMGAVAMTPKTLIREMPKGSEGVPVDMHDPFKAGKTAQQHLDQVTVAQVSGESEAYTVSGDRKSIEAMTPKTVMREAPVGSLGSRKLPPVDSGRRPKENAADILREFKSKSSSFSPGVGRGAGAKASQGIPFSTRGADPPPMQPVRAGDSEEIVVERSRKGEPQIVGGPIRKTKRERKSKPLPPSTITVPYHTGRYESFLLCINGTLNVLIIFTLVVMVLYMYSIHGDKLSMLWTDLLHQYPASVWPGGSSEL